MLFGSGALLAALVTIQLVPYGRAHHNPPVTSEPAWDSPRTRELAVRACFDCHSNETKWPWYAHVAPLSWAVQFDVDVAREAANYSEWERPQPLAVYSGARTHNGMMPPKKYIATHPLANLTPEEREELARGLDRTFGTPETQAPPR